MGSYPLAANNIQQPASPLDSYGKVLGLQQLLARQKTEQLQQVGLQQQNQENALQLQDQQTLRSIAPKYVTKDADGNPTGFDFKGFLNGAAGANVNPLTLQKIQMGQLDLTQKMAATTSAQRENLIAGNRALYEGLESVRSVPLPQRQQALQAALPKLKAAGIDTSQFQGNVPLDDASLTSFEAGLGQHAQTLADAKTMAETQADLAKKQEAETAAKKLQAEMDPNSSLYAPSPASVSLGTAPGASQIQAGEVGQAARKAAAEASARMPFEIAQKKAEQAVTDGDPNAAAQLLINGDVAPSQIISSRKPAFAQQAFTAAQQMSGGKWNAQKAEADFKIASSPSNVAFFGSAKSLTDPGGTLDQLKAAAKDIPDGQIPVFNSLADWTKAAMGSGPIAKYAAVNLGVADDYAKVMGGGTATDTGRTQGLSLVPAKASPEARDAAIEGIRGAVGSQINSRIGQNSVLQRQYGSQNNAPHATPKDLGAAPTGAKEGDTGKFNGVSAKIVNGRIVSQ